MPDIWLDVNLLVVVPVNILPLLDDTDFKTIETAIVYNSAGLTITWNFVTSAGGVTATSVTPTTAGGTHNWSEPIADRGMYGIEIPASGGTSINNNAVGYGWFTGVATGVLPWRGPTVGFRAAGINDKLCDSAYDATRGLAGTALPGAAADAAGGLPISDAGGLDLDAIKTDVVNAVWATPSRTLSSIDNVKASVVSSVWATPTRTLSAGVTVAAGGIDSLSFGASAVDAAAFAQDAAQEVADEMLNRDLAGGASGGARIVRDALRVLRNKVNANLGIVYQENDTTTAWTFTVATDSAATRITGIDPN